ncbi:MAG: hypothetical protein NT003_01995 [Candidatus Magasanikbacteria bacterium]|nr:hypothetical protein [Candidatus Magasanikbacteria bacterium]
MSSKITIKDIKPTMFSKLEDAKYAIVDAERLLAFRKEEQSNLYKALEPVARFYRDYDSEVRDGKLHVFRSCPGCDSNHLRQRNCEALADSLKLHDLSGLVLHYSRRFNPDGGEGGWWWADRYRDELHEGEEPRDYGCTVATRSVEGIFEVVFDLDY